VGADTTGGSSHRRFRIVGDAYDDDLNRSCSRLNLLDFSLRVPLSRKVEAYFAVENVADTDYGFGSRRSRTWALPESPTGHRGAAVPLISLAERSGVNVGSPKENGFVTLIGDERPRSVRDGGLSLGNHSRRPVSDVCRLWLHTRLS
jgi:uncharacterized protein involved in tellurium resistance